MTGGATIDSAGTCSAGGIAGAGAISPKPEVDCPVIEDPLADRAPPTIGGCDFLDFELDKGDSMISPGTYCGGIKMANKAVVHVEPGIYVITGDKLDMGNKTELYGEGVSFYFADDAAGFDFRDKGGRPAERTEGGAYGRDHLLFDDRRRKIQNQQRFCAQAARHDLPSQCQPRNQRGQGRWRRNQHTL